jgi:hypothetical protein
LLALLGGATIVVVSRLRVKPSALNDAGYVLQGARLSLLMIHDFCTALWGFFYLGNCGSLQSNGKACIYSEYPLTTLVFCRYFEVGRPGSSVGIVTAYGLDVLGIESW